MNSITSIPTTITPKIITTVTTPRHQPPEFQRRHSCPVRSSSYDRGLFKREMYLKAYTIPPTSSSLSGDDISTLISYTGLSSPRLAPIETNVPLDSPPADISDFTDLSPSLLDTSRRYKSHPQRRLSYDRNLYNKVMFTKAYNTPSSSLSPSLNNNHLSYTGLSSPKLLPIELNNNNHNNANNNTNNTNNNYNGDLYITSTRPTTTSSSNRPSSPFSSKKITDDFLFRDNWPQEVIR